MNDILRKKMNKYLVEGDTIDRSIRSLLFDSETADRVLIVNNSKAIPIHSFIVSLRSSVLRSMIKNNVYKYEIYLLDEDEDSIMQMIRFIYTDDIISYQYLVNMIVLGHRYKVTFMSHYCEFLFHKLSKRKKIIALRYFCACRLLPETTSRGIDYVIFANLVSTSILSNDADLSDGLIASKHYLYTHYDNDNNSNSSTTANVINSSSIDSDSNSTFNKSNINAITTDSGIASNSSNSSSSSSSSSS